MTSVPLKYVASTSAGQSPPSTEVDILENGLPFLQGNAEFAERAPLPKYQCSAPPKRARAGDILLSVRAPVGALNVADRDYGIGRGLCAITPERCDDRFLWWWLHSQRGRLDAVSTGTTYASITGEDVGALPFPSIDLDEQRRIADFLDAETARIDRLSAKRKKMKGLLGLKRERIIEFELGVDGQGSTQHKLVPLKYLADEITVGIVITPARWYVAHDGVPALRGVNVKPGRIIHDDVALISTKGHLANQKSRLQAGDVVVVRTGQSGAAAVVPQDFDGANCIDLIVIRPGKKLAPRYVEYVLNSGYAGRRVDEYSVGSIQGHFNIGAMKQIPFPALPRSEQERAVNRLDSRVEPIDHLVRRLDQQDSVLQERRRALITATVTGQLDVSTAARTTTTPSPEEKV